MSVQLIFSQSCLLTYLCYMFHDVFWHTVACDGAMKLVDQLKPIVFAQSHQPVVYVLVIWTLYDGAYENPEKSPSLTIIFFYPGLWRTDSLLEIFGRRSIKKENWFWFPDDSWFDVRQLLFKEMW